MHDPTSPNNVSRHSPDSALSMARMLPLEAWGNPNDMWADLDDGDLDLTKFTEGLTSACLNFRFPDYIDHIVTDTRRW